MEVEKILHSSGILRLSGSNTWLKDVFIQLDRSRKERGLNYSLDDHVKEKQNQAKDGLCNIRLLKGLFPMLLMKD